MASPIAPLAAGSSLMSNSPSALLSGSPVPTNAFTSLAPTVSTLTCLVVSLESVTVNVGWDDLSPVVSRGRIAELVTAEEDRLLDAHKKGGGWYHFGEGDALVKVQGRDDALAELAKRQEAANAAGQPAGGE